jgi:predicted permease
LDLAAQLGTIFYRVVLPILLVVGTGFVVQRILDLDLKTLTNVHFFCIMPVVVFTSLVGSELRGTDVGIIVAFGVIVIAIMGVLTYLASLLIRTPRDRRAAVTLSGMMQNSGNFGMPLQRLAFRGTGSADAALAMQSFLLISQSIMTFTVGISLASGGHRRLKLREQIVQILRLPPLYALMLGLIVLGLRRFPAASSPVVVQGLDPLWQAMQMIRGAFIGLALFVLGAQLATIRTGDRGQGDSVGLAVAMRLLVTPILSYVLIRLGGFEGFMARVLLIGTANPTAINTLLLCMKFENSPEYVARAVLYSTLLAPLTVTPVIHLAGVLFP